MTSYTSLSEIQILQSYHQDMLFMCSFGWMICRCWKLLSCRTCWVSHMLRVDLHRAEVWKHLKPLWRLMTINVYFEWHVCFTNEVSQSSVKDDTNTLTPRITGANSQKDCVVFAAAKHEIRQRNHMILRAFANIYYYQYDYITVYNKWIELPGLGKWGQHTSVFNLHSFSWPEGGNAHDCNKKNQILCKVIRKWPYISLDLLPH